MDGDRGVPNRINYTIEKGPCSQLFTIESNGSIRTNNTIDRDSGSIAEAGSTCILNIMAFEVFDSTSQPNNILTNTTAEARITIQDVNDEIPTFNSPSYEAEVFENTAQNIPLTLVNVTEIEVYDLDEDKYAQMDLTLHYENDTDCKDFEVTPSRVQGRGSLIIRVKNSGVLDYEARPGLKIKIKATETADTSHNATALVTVNIRDINDNNPQFGNKTYFFKVPENSANGTSVGNITANDTDSEEYANLTFSLTGGADRFTIDAQSGEMRTLCSSNCSQEFDRERQQSFYMTVTASDGAGRSNSTSVQVDLLDGNDEAPRFRQPHYFVYVKEMETERYINASLVVVQAEDADEPNTNNSKIGFRLVDTDPKLTTNFTIGNTSGEVFLNYAIDYEKLNETIGIVNVTVAAYDHGHSEQSTHVTVTITVEDGNDNSPVFNCTVFKGNVSENATSNATSWTTVGNVYATDEDGTKRNNECQYFIYSGAFDHFSVNASSGEVYVKNGASLDRETRDQYDITIIAIDTGSPPRTGTTTFQALVLDVNDRSPTFNVKFDATIRENDTSFVSKSFKQINASDVDLNNELNYSFVDWKGFDENNKEIKSNEMDKVKNYFKINNTDGNVYVRSNDTLPDREVANVIQITVLVSDINAYNPVPQTATATLTITLQDVNDNAPIFSNETEKNVSMRENAGSGSILTTIQAYDIDENRTIKYAIVEGPNPTGAFDINAKGEIRKNGILDREANASVVLTINATDNGIPPLWSTLDVTVTILDVNDNTPVIHKANYTVTILENITNEEHVFHVNASDEDDGQNGNVTFSLETSQDMSFAIDPITGNISVNNCSWIDRERLEKYTIQIIATDNPSDDKEQRSVKQEIIIFVDDLNDNAPEFINGGHYYVKAREDFIAGTFVMKVSASDRDKAGTPNANIVYTIAKSSSQEGLFKIDLKTGDISTNQSLHDNYGNVTLEVLAEDSGEPKLSGTTTVVIFIDDVNLNNPTITNLPSNNTLNIYECHKLDKSVFDFNHTDNDKGDNALATFNMTAVEGSSNLFEYFKMDSDGILSLVKPLSNISVDEFFYVQATDKGSPPLSSDKHRIKIHVMDVNDHPPYFEKENVTLAIAENSPAWSSVGQLTSKDPDRDSIACYYIEGHQEEELFVVGETNGTVHAKETFDFETHQKNFSVTVSVKDCSTTVNASAACDDRNKTEQSVRSTQKVIIIVLDTNDNPPVFKTKEITFGMRRTTEVNVVLHLNLKDYVKDNDTDGNNTYGSWVFNNTGSIEYSDSLKGEQRIGHANCADGQKHVICINGNGSVMNNKFFSEDRSGYILVPVKVHDINGKSETNIRIYLIGDSEIMKMVVFGNKTAVSDRKDGIMKLYSDITDHTFVYDWLEDHKDSNGRVDTFRTDLYFHVVNKDGRILSADEALRLVDRFSYEMMQAQSQYSISEVTKWITADNDEESPLKTVYILVALVVVLTLTIAIIIYVSIVTRNNYKRKLQAATINTHEFKDGKVENEFIPGSNQYSRQSNPLLNATIPEKVVYDNISLESDNSFDPAVVGDGGLAPTYDGLEEQVRTLDMYTEVAPGQGDIESPLDAALRLHDMHNLQDKPDTISTEGIVSANDIDALTFSNPGYLEGLESSEI